MFQRFLEVLNIFITYRKLLMFDIFFLVVNIMVAFALQRAWLMFIIIVGIRLPRLLFRKLAGKYKNHKWLFAVEYHFRLLTCLVIGPLSLTI